MQRPKTNSARRKRFISKLILLPERVSFYGFMIVQREIARIRMLLFC